jgi:hypothetical protein
MKSISKALLCSAALATANAHGVILGAQGEAGPPSFGFKGDLSSHNILFLE